MQMGANLLSSDGASFRVWAPRASAVYLNGSFGGVEAWEQTSQTLMAKGANGCWTAFVQNAREGDPYKYFVVGPGGSGYKRDPFARELGVVPAFPHCNCILRDPTSYPWHDAGFQPPNFSDAVIYQLHIGSYAPRTPGVPSTFLDVIEKIEYLAALGINLLQPLPIDETETCPSFGYNGSDYFSPDTPYVVRDPDALADYLTTINRLLAAKGFAPLQARDIESGPNQLKALIDLCHLYGIAVTFDVVYNHAGGFMGDDESLYFYDRATPGNNNDSLYFTDRGWAGGLSFALWNADVRQFLIDSALYYLNEFHVDGFRYDEISALLALNGSSGWNFCRDLTSTVRFVKPRALQNAEHWPVNSNIVQTAESGGAGFDVIQHDALREALRIAVAQASYGASAALNLDAIANALYPSRFEHAWQAVTCVENHDIVKVGEHPRIPRLADPSNPRSWYARSRSRVASALLLTAPGIPMLFMGQEFLEEKPWSDANADALIAWASPQGEEKAAADHLRFTQDAVALRRSQPALRGQSIRVFHVHNGNRIIAFHRWLEEEGRDIIVVSSLSEQIYTTYDLGFPYAGRWLEIFNSDAYDNWPNPHAAGNGGAVEARNAPLHGFQASCAIVIPANGVLVFARGLA